MLFACADLVEYGFSVAMHVFASNAFRSFRSARSVGSQLKIVPTWPVLGRVELSGGSPGNQSSGYIGGGSESFTDLGEGINN